MRNTSAVLAEFPELITLNEFMEYLQCSRSKATEICREKHGFSFKIGGTWYIDKRRFIDWMNKQCRL